MAADGYEAVLTNLFEEDLDTELAWRAHEVGPGSAASFLDSFEQAKDAAVSFPAFMPQVEGSDYRWVPVKKRVAVFRIDERARRVVFLRLYNASSNWKSVLRKTAKS